MVKSMNASKVLLKKRKSCSKSAKLCALARNHEWKILTQIIELQPVEPMLIDGKEDLSESGEGNGG